MCIHSLYHHMTLSVFFFFFFNDTATTEIYTLSLHDALPILSVVFQPIDGIERDPPLSPDLEVEVRAAVARLAAHVPRSEEHSLNSSHSQISYAVFCLKKKKTTTIR